MSRRIAVYTASKITQATRWINLRNDWPEVNFTARWPFCHVGQVPDEPCYAKLFWQQDEADVRAANVVLVYGEPGEHLRGALVEAGMALALGMVVIVVGDHEDYGTWQYHPGVYRVADLDSARILLKCLTMEQLA